MKTMPYLAVWKAELVKTHGVVSAKSLVQAMLAHHDILISEIPVPDGKLLKARREKLILPGLALYLTLKDSHRDAEKALAETDALFRLAFFRVERLGLSFLRFLPDPFPFVRLVMRQSAVSEYGPDELAVLEDSPDCFSLNIYRCYIFDTLTAQDAPELTALYCATDDWLSNLLPSVKWERTQTLGRGGTHCDFCWRRG